MSFLSLQKCSLSPIGKPTTIYAMTDTNQLRFKTNLRSLKKVRTNVIFWQALVYQLATKWIPLVYHLTTQHSIAEHSSGRSCKKAATTAARTDSDLAQIVQHFQAEIGEFPRSALDKLQRYREAFSTELICKAIDEAAENGVRKWRYVDGILKGWQADGVRTLGDVEARREARRKPEPPQEKKMEVLT